MDKMRNEQGAGYCCMCSCAALVLTRGCRSVRQISPAPANVNSALHTLVSCCARELRNAVAQTGA